MGRIQDAIAAYRLYIFPEPKASTSTNPYSPILMKYGLLLMQASQNEEAIEMYERAVIRLGNNDYRRALFTDRFRPIGLNRKRFEAVARVLIAASDVDFQSSENIAEYRKAIALQPDYAAAYYFLGFALEQSDQQFTPQLAKSIGEAYRKAYALGRGAVKEAAAKKLPKK